MIIPSVKPKSTFTEEEYLLLEEHATERSEYYDGEIFAMYGGSIDHAIIASNLATVLGSRLRDTICRGLGSDARISIPGKSYFYPDYMVVCGKIGINRVGTQEAIANPSIIFEVLSESTADFDRTGKFERYKTIPTLRQYVLIDSRKIQIWSYYKEENWVESPTKSEITLYDIKLILNESDIYNGTSFIEL